MTDVTDAPAIDLTANDAFDGHHPWEQYAWLRANDPVHWHPEADGPGLLGDHAVRRHPRRSAASRSCSARRRGASMMAETDEEDLAGPAPDDAGDGPAPARPLQAARQPRLHARRRRSRCAAASRSWPARSSTTSSSAASATSSHDISGRLPSGLIAELMGIPRADGERLYELTELMHTTDDAVASPEQRQAATFEMLALRRRDGRPQAGRAGRRHRLAAGAGRGRRRAAHRRRAAVVLPAARQRRRRHDAQPAGRGHPAAVRPPRRAGPAAGRPRRPARHEHRGDAALHVAGRPLPPHRDGGHGRPRPADQGRRQADGVLRLGQPRRGRVRRTPTASTSAATRTRTWPSAAAARTCASASTSPASRSP